MMLEFVQTHGSWIVFGLFFLVMMRMHGGHGGMGHGASCHGQPSDSHDHGAAAPEATGAQTEGWKSSEKTGCH